MREHVALAAGIALACVSSASLAADFPTDVSAPIPPSISDRFYVSFHGGYTFGNRSHDLAYDTDPTTGNPLVGATFLSESFSKPGYRVGAAIGRNFGVLSVEGEISYSHAEIDHAHLISANGVPVGVDVPAIGSGSTLTGMINVIAGTDFGSVRPYVGGGAGFAYFTAHNINSPPPPVPPEDRTILNGSDTGLAVQAIAGIDFALTDSMTIGGRYRFLYLTDLSLMDGGYKHDFSSTSQSVEVVLTNSFN